MPPQTTSVQKRPLETASVWALIGTLIATVAIVIPVATFPFMATKAFVLAAGVLITLALYILTRLSRGSVILPPALLVGALWLPVIAYLLSALFSGMPLGSAFWGSLLGPDTLGFMLAAGVLGTLAALVFRRTDQYRTFFVSLGWTLGAVALVEIIALIVGQFAPNIVSPSFALLGSTTDLAIVLGLGVVVSLMSLRLLELGKGARQRLIALGVVSLVLLAVFTSTLVWIMVALVSLGLFVEAVMKRSPSAADAELDDVALVSESGAESESGSRSLVMPLATLAVSLFFLIGGTLSGALASSLHANVLSIRPSWQSTLAVGAKTYAHAPLFGTGPGSFGTEWLKYRDASLNSTVFWSVDFNSGIGFVPTAFVTTGIVGALLWLAFFALFLVFGVRAILLRAPKDAYARYASILSFVATIYLFAAAVFDVPGPVVLALAFVFAGVFASTVRYSPGKEQWGVIFARAPRLGFVIVFALTLLLLASVVAAYGLVERYVASVALTRASVAYNAGNLNGAAANAQTSLAFSPTPDAYRLESSVALGQLSVIAASSTMAAADAQKEFQTALSGGINAALTATQIAPNDYQNWMMLGNLYASAVPLNVQSAYESAKTAYEKAAALNPTNPQIPYTLAQLEIAHKDTKAAEADLTQAISLKQDYTAAIFLLSQLYVQDGNVKDALASAEAAAYFTPNDANVLFQVGVLRAASNDLPGAAQALSAAVAANPQFANARYFLAAVYAKQGDTKSALDQVQAIADMSADNAKTVAAQLTALEAGKDPFPSNLFSASSTQPTAPQR